MARRVTIFRKERCGCLPASLTLAASLTHPQHAVSLARVVGHVGKRILLLVAARVVAVDAAGRGVVRERGGWVTARVPCYASTRPAPLRMHCQRQ